MTPWILMLAGLVAVTVPHSTHMSSVSLKPLAVLPDTVVTLHPGDRVLVNGLSGRLSVRPNAGDRLSVTTGRRNGEIRVRRDGQRVVVTAQDGSGRDRVDVEVSLPPRTDLRIEGMNLDVDVAGLEAEVEIEIITGDIGITETSGRVSARTMDGEIVVRDTRGTVNASTHTDDIFVHGAQGPLVAVSLDGDIAIDGSSAPSVQAETQSGDVDFSGVIEPEGRYAFRVHSGDIRLALPADLDARVRASTFHGEFQSEFQAVTSEFASGRAFDFTLGHGGAEIVVEVFDGEIRLVRQGGGS